MKKVLSVILALSLVLCLCPVDIHAASSEAQDAAQKLYELGLFSGTGTDASGKPIFDLDRAPTRHEAVTMLVRLLGKDSAAKSGTWTTPFSDVADWAKPYVGYAYANKLANGTSATTFSGDDAVSAAQYITFVLRALGYSSDSDFQWDKSWELSDKLGFTDGRYKGGSATFTRGDVAIISASALDAKLKGGSDTLLATLQKSGAVASASEAISELQIIRYGRSLNAEGDVSPYSDHWYEDKARITTNLSNNPGLAYSLTIGEKTIFNGIPDGYDPNTLIEWGKTPFLGVEVLHDLGYTGKGVTVAYVDQPVSNHPEFEGLNWHYSNDIEGNGANDSMHGPSVLSILAGQNIGVIPDAEVYFYANPSWLRDQRIHGSFLDKIIELNETLPEGKKITMVGYSDVVDSSEDYPEAFQKAVDDAKAAGIMVWLADEFGSTSFIPGSNRDLGNASYVTYTNAINASIYVPTGGRSTARTVGGKGYIYWSSGGVSWAVPYAMGVFAIMADIDPTLTQDEIRQMAHDTGYAIDNGGILINPVELVAHTLEKVGRDEDAKELRTALAKRIPLNYAVLSTNDDKQRETIGNYLAQITNGRVFFVDGTKYADEKAIIEAIQNDAKDRGGSIGGVAYVSVDGNRVKQSAVGNYPMLEINPVANYLCESFGAYDEASLKRYQHRALSHITDANPIGESKAVKFTTRNELADGKSGTIQSYTAQPLDNDCTRFTVIYTIPEQMKISVFNPPEGNLFMLLFNTGNNIENGELVFDLKNEDLQKIYEVSVNFYDNYSNHYWVFFQTDQLKLK